jgi:hypothetical protein
MPSSNGSTVTAVKLKAKDNSFTVAMLPLHIPQKSA